MTIVRKKSELEQLISDVHSFGINYHGRELYLHPRTDSEFPGVEYGMAVQFVKNLDFLNNQSPNNVLVRMQTMGGDWSDGMAIYDAITFSVAPVTILSYAHARSMSSIILQAADCRVFMPHTEFMVHFGTQADENSYLNYVSGADFSKIQTERMLRAYAKRCIWGEHFQKRYKGVTEEKVMDYIKHRMQEKGDWWMKADEAVYYGFADGIFGQPGYETLAEIRVEAKWNAT